MPRRMSLLTRRGHHRGASVSCIYGLGTPQSYLDRSVDLKVGGESSATCSAALVDVQYTRNDIAFARGTFRCAATPVRSFRPTRSLAVRVEFFGDEIDRCTTCTR